MLIKATLRFCNVSLCRLFRPRNDTNAIVRRFASDSMTQINLKTIFVVLLWVTFAHHPTVSAQFVQQHDDKTPSWIRHQGDSRVDQRLWRQRRSSGSDTNGQTISWESVNFQNGPGTHLYISHEIPPAYLIPELKPAVRIKSETAGIKLMVRVVLPHTPAPDGDGPMTTTLTGQAYATPGQWQTLTIGEGEFDTDKLLTEELWYLKRKYGKHVTGQAAFIDRVVLNLYTKPGKHEVLIDKVTLDGAISAKFIASKSSDLGGSATSDLAGNAVEDVEDTDPTDPVAAVRPVIDFAVTPATKLASSKPRVEKRPSLIQRDGTVLLAEKRPFFPLIIEHNGEGFDFLKAIGFNTVELKATASKEQLAEAEALDMWIVCPPPASIGVSDIGFEYDRVLAWSVGRNLKGRDLQTVQQRVREIHESDLRKNRPIVANVESSWSRIAAQADILSVGLEPLGTSFLASQYSQWLQQRAHSVATSKPVWADIQTELSQPLLEQIGTISSQLPPTPIESQQMKFLVVEAIAGGARGLRFRSRGRLDASDPVSRLRTMTIELTNAFIDQIKPWAVGGALLGEIDTSDSDLQVTAINTNRARLLLIQRPTHHEQYWAGDVPIKTVTFNDSSSAFTDRAWQISDTRLKLLPTTRELGGTKIEIPDCPFITAVVLTQDPVVVNQLTESYERVGKQSIQQMRSELTQQWIAIMQLIDKQIAKMGRRSPSVGGSINEAVTAYRVANDMISKQSPDLATRFLDRTDERLSFSRRETAIGPLGLFQSKTSTPFVAHASLIPLHWQLTNRLKESGPWNPNGLAAGDFESLEHMKLSGWENHRVDLSTATTRVELTSDEVVLGQKSLKLSVSPAATGSGGSPMLEEAPLWIVSPSVKVRPGQMVQIHGWVNVPEVVMGNFDGLKISDSVSGEALAERIAVTRGWEEFTLYRSVGEAGQMSVRFDMTGFGTVYLDEVTIRTIELK